MTPEFQRWWNADDMLPENPYPKDTPIWWAWEGWQAAIAAHTHTAQHHNMVKLIADVERCYRVLLTEANTKAALFKAEEMLRAALADAKESAVLKANGIGGE